MSGIGHIGELQTITEFEEYGYAVYLPMKDNEKITVGLHSFVANYSQAYVRPIVQC